MPSDRPPEMEDTNHLGNVYLGFTQIHLGTTDRDGQQTEDAWEQLGFDLDGLCTNSATCTAGSSMLGCRNQGPATPFDGQLCRDNSFGRLQPVISIIPDLGPKLGLSEDAFNCQLWRGGYNMLLRLSGFNGEQNDLHVRVDYYLSPGLEDAAAWKCPMPDYRTNYARWRSGRKWAVDDSSFKTPIKTDGELPDSTFADGDAYVKYGYLVARVPEGTQQGFIGDADPYRGFLFPAHQGVFVGRLSQGQDGTWEIGDGLIAGRILKTDLVRSFREAGFCERGDLSTFYQTLIDTVNETSDVLASGAVDATMNCDAMSYAIGFEAAQLLPGQGVKVPPRVECCAPGVSLQDCMTTCGDGMLNGDETCDTAIPVGSMGACPSTCGPTDGCVPQVLSGSGCAAVCMPMPISVVGAKDGCCPKGAKYATDADCMGECDNGVIETGETCDPKSSCKPCTSPNACLTAHATGSVDTCDLRCELTPITSCTDGDSCCPAGCHSSNDKDCPTTCANSTLDPGELCEAGTNKPCPTSCDDKIACTKDVLTGSADNCTATCTYTPITEAADGDGCCPPNVGANPDSDCKTDCGNHVVESGEQCDDGNDTAGDGCFNCKTESPLQVCLARIGSTDACAQCTCSQCTNQSLTCYDDKVASDVKLCRDMVQCQHDSHCSNPDCFCGPGGLYPCITGAPNGPCKNQIIAAAKSASLTDISARSMDNTFPLGWANAVFTCQTNNCQAACGH
jgi:cysteine-rich repeat protein